MNSDLSNVYRNQYNVENLLEYMPEGYIIYRASGDILFASRKVMEIFECDSSEEFMELTRGNFRNMVHEDDYSAVMKNIDEKIMTGNQHFFHNRYRILTKNGHSRYVEDFVRIVHNQTEGILFYEFLIDSELKLLTYDIDHVTDLPGMRRFLETAGRTLEVKHLFHDSPQSVFLYFNITKFKLYNINYGIDAGDRFLYQVAACLSNVFASECISRFSDDHFVALTEREHLEERISRVRMMFRELHPGSQMELKAGIYVMDDSSVSLSAACDMARIACDSIRGNVSKYYAFYDPALSREAELHEYVAEHIDEAVEKGWIQVYYQPVVRTISGALCGMEALARWNDPEKGLLSPEDFIPTLESTGQIYKLDSEVARQACKNYAVQLGANVPIVPVSFNLSRLNFISCDIFQVLEDAMKKYDVPKDMIHVEITESMLVQDQDSVGREIDRFHHAGYEVWMDDFGSGYSSLNLLKDYDFDEIKIDMDFLSSFTERSRDIITSTVEMAKKLGIKTLAEGVETREQAEFLQQIGCSQVQGYYYGKPEPYEEALRHCTERGLEVETRAWRKYYDEIGKVNFITDMPLAVIEDNGSEFHFLFANPAYIDTLRSLGNQSLKEAEFTMNSPLVRTSRVLRQFIEKPVSSGEEEVIVYPSGNQLVRLSMRMIASCNHRYVHVSSITNISENADRDARERMDFMLRNVYNLYDRIRFVDIREDYMEDLDSSIGLVPEHRSMVHGLSKWNAEYARNHIYIYDRKRFLDFSDYTTIPDRLRDSESGVVSDYFRTKDRSGNFIWKEHTVISLPKTGEKQMLHCIRTATLEELKAVQYLPKEEQESNDMESRYAESGSMQYMESGKKGVLMDGPVSMSELWKNMIRESEICFFWKDSERRFLGVSQSFLDYYGLDSAEELIGKTDEDMRWHINDGPYQDDEWKVIREGARVHDAPGKCIIGGIVHNIVCNKMPLYKEGRIVGLLGYFMDAERIAARENNLGEVVVTDPVTDTMNIRGIVESFANYEEEYRIHDNDYVIVALSIPEYRRIYQNYGQDIAEKLLREAARRLRDILGTGGSLGRVKEGEFVLFLKYSDRNYVQNICDRIAESLKGIREIDNRDCTIYAKLQISYGSESFTVKNFFSWMFGE